VYGDTLSSFNDTSYRGGNGNRSGNDSNANEINKIIDNKLKPLEAKQNNFMQMMHNILYNNSNSSINGSIPPYYNYNYNDVVNNEMNVNHQQQQTPFIVQNACENEIYGHKTIDVNSIVKEKVLETVLRERITKENAMRENELRKMLQREKQLREKEESIVKDKDKRILELENKEKLLEMQQNEMKKKLEGYEAANKNEVCRCAYSNMIVHPENENENEKKNKIERTNSDNNIDNADNADIEIPKKKPNTKRHNKSLIAHNPNIEYNENESDEWNNIDYSKYLNQKPKRNNTKKKRKKKNNSNNNMNNSVKKQIRLEKSDYPKMWLGRRVDSGVLDD
jgi:hypothetical protein